MKLKSFGCSFIYGSDLPDCPHGQGIHHPPPSQLTWPALLAKHHGLEYACFAWPGIGNLRILERILHEIGQDEKAFFVISWTWIDRLDYLDKDHDIFQPWSWKSIMPNDTSPFAQAYYKDYHGQFKDQLSSAVYIKQAIDLLQDRKLPYFMTYQDDLILDRTHNHPGLSLLQDQIRSEMRVFEGKTFLDWSRDQGFQISDNWHPLEKAHRAAADYIAVIDAIPHTT